MEAAGGTFRPPLSAPIQGVNPELPALPAVFPITVLTEKFLGDGSVVQLDAGERERLERAVSHTLYLPARKTVIRSGEPMSQSLLLVDGIMARYIDDRHGNRQLVAVHVTGDFVDLHAFPLKVLDHDVATITPCRAAMVPHSALEDILHGQPGLTRKLWYSTLIDAAIHRAWLFRLGRLDAVGRVAHFFCETHRRLAAVGCAEGADFTTGLTQADLAEICGLTTVHINRVLRQLREEGLCRFGAGRVEILDLARLSARGQFDADYLYLAGPSQCVR